MQVEKPKNTELNFLYMDEKYQKQENKRKKDAKIEKTKLSQNSKKRKKRAGSAESAPEDAIFNFDNEIVIGVTKIPDSNKKSNTRKTNTSNTRKQVINSKKQVLNSNKGKNTVKQSKIKKSENIQNKKNTNIDRRDSSKYVNNKFAKGIIKWTILLSALVASFIFFMMSPLFNLSNVQVINNEKISTDTILSISGLKIGENIYKTSSKQIEKNIKQNTYIESVNIKRKLPNEIILTVKERRATYSLEYANSYAYINNQGYILEISEEKLELPIIMGYTTSGEEIKPGNRLNSEDLEKLSTVLKIMESANANEIGNTITRINIQNKQDYVIILEGEKKTVHLGDVSKLSDRIGYLKKVLEEEKGIEGEIFINGDLNKDKVYFRPKE